MKKLLTLALCIILVFTLTLSVTAAEFVESITNKGAPQLVVDMVDGKPVVGNITGPNGEQLTIEYLECLIITSVADAPNDPDIPDEARELLLKVYEELSKSDMNLSELCPELNDIIKEKWGEDKSVDDLVVKDLFDITDDCEDLKENLKDGATLDLTFDIGIGSNVFITAMVYVDGKWQPVVDCINNGDGTVTVIFDKICPVAFLVPATAANSSTTSPTTGDFTSVVIWSTVMLASIAAFAFLLVYSRKKSKA